MTYRVHLGFFCVGSEAGAVWVVQFSPPSLDRAIGPIRQWPSADAIRELIARTPTKMDSEAKQILEFAIAKGRGAMFLDVTPEQYASLHLKSR
jgi:hypothetical protein